MTFRDALIRWNGGIERGARRRLARALGVSEGNVSGWVSGSFPPGGERRLQIAQALGVKHSDIDAMFPRKETEIGRLQREIAELRARVEALERCAERVIDPPIERISMPRAPGQSSYVADEKSPHKSKAPPGRRRARSHGRQTP